MTSPSLIFGSAFLAFGPTASFLFLIAYEKAQLIIVLTTSAFAFLISCLLAALFWNVFHFVGLEHPLLTILPGIFFQFALRCGFVSLYHRVEEVIQTSIDRHEEEQTQESQNQNEQDSDQDLTESARLRLELNDWACGLAAGTGFGGMHAVMLYGTLLASESGNLGTLYQPSCPAVPSLILSAVNTFMFSILDVLWMLFTFFGMRRRAGIASVSSIRTSGIGSMLGNSKQSGNLALGISVVSHAAAAISTLPNEFEGGCFISVPILAAIVVCTSIIFWVGISKIFLPAKQRRRVSGDAHRD